MLSRFLFKQKTAYDIQVAVAVEVGRHRGAGPRQKADGVMFKFEIAFILEPLDAVPGTRAWRQVIKSVPIRVEDVYQAVLVQVDEPDAAAAVVFVGAAPNQVRLEVSVTIVFEDVDLL